jgi:hypothetical protein
MSTNGETFTSIMSGPSFLYITIDTGTLPIDNHFYTRFRFRFHCTHTNSAMVAAVVYKMFKQVQQTHQASNSMPLYAVNVICKTWRHKLAIHGCIH